MRSRHPASFREQLGTLRRQFLQDGDLPFTDVLTEEVIAQALAAVTGWLDRPVFPTATMAAEWPSLSRAPTVRLSPSPRERLTGGKTCGALRTEHPARGPRSDRGTQRPVSPSPASR
jgi:hypothetical protein